MTVSPESPSPYNSEFSSLDESLQERFGKLIHDYAAELAMHTTPDEMTFETRSAAFGQFKDCEIDVTHRVIKCILPGRKPTHTGSVKFSHIDDSSKSLFVDHLIAWNTLTTTWKTPSKVYRGKHVLNHLFKNWPISDDFDKVPLVNAITDSEIADITPEQIFDALESYILRNNEGESTATSKWEHSQTLHDSFGRPHTNAIELTTSETSDRFSRKELRYTTDYQLGDNVVQLDCQITINELNDVSIVASYEDPDTGQRRIKQITEYDKFYDEVKLELERFFKVKVSS